MFSPYLFLSAEGSHFFEITRLDCHHPRQIQRQGHSLRLISVCSLESLNRSGLDELTSIFHVNGLPVKIEVPRIRFIYLICHVERIEAERSTGNAEMQLLLIGKGKR